MTAQDHRYARRAAALWPGLDAARLRRTRGDPRRIVRLVSGRTLMPEESILDLLLMADDPPSPRGHGAREPVAGFGPPTSRTSP